MPTRHPLCIVVLTFLCVATGCRSANQNAPSQSAGNSAAPAPLERAGGPTAADRAAAPVVQSAPPPGTAEALAQRASTYAQSVQPLLAQRPSHRDVDGIARTEESPAKEKTESPAVEATTAPATLPAAPAQKVAAAPDPHDPPAPPVRKEQPQDPAPELLPKVAQRARDYPQDLWAQLDFELLQFLRDEPVPDLQSLAGLQSEDRELLSALMDGLSNFRNQLRADNNMLFSKKVRPLIEMVDRVRGQAELSVPSVVLCSSVQAFGVYQPIDPARFVAGAKNQPVVYYEVENFASQLNASRIYETRLTQDIALYVESTGQEVWRAKQRLLVDLAHRRRHDFFMAERITLPKALGVNRYLLKVSIEDQQAKHFAENTIPLEIVAQ